MALAVIPDGYRNSDCSDSDELEMFDGNEEWDDNNYGKPVPVKYEPNPKEIYQRKCDNFYSDIVAGDANAIAESLQDIDLNVELRGDWTPLLLAASIGNRKIVKMLLDKGADVHKHKDHLTALMAACKCPDGTSPYENSAECVQLLIDYGIDVNLKNRKRMTALMFAASSGNHLAVEKLLPICDIHALDQQGWHALFWAVNDKRINIVVILIEAGLNINQVDVRKQSLIDLAMVDCIEEIVSAIDPQKLNENMCNTYSEKTFSYFNEECTTRNETTNKPNFYREVSMLLNGSRSEQYLPQFMENNVDLYSYLTIDNNKLQQIGIATPFQRYRVLKGLYKFHKSPYKSKSVPIIKAGSEATTLDIARTVVSFIRQITAMEASLQYLMNQEVQTEEGCQESKDILKNVQFIRAQLKTLKIYCGDLEKLAENWDESNAPVDVINKKSVERFKRKQSVWCMLVPMGCVLFVGYWYLKRNV